jgi:hypothetical protein
VFIIIVRRLDVVIIKMERLFTTCSGLFRFIPSQGAFFLIRITEIVDNGKDLYYVAAEFFPGLTGWKELSNKPNR